MITIRSLSLALMALTLACASPYQALVKANRAYEHGDREAAIEAYQEALSSPETRAVAHLNLGRVYLETAEAPLALEHLEAGLSERPQFALGLAQRAQVMLDLGRTGAPDLRAVETDLRKALLLEPRLPSGWLQMARLRIAQGDDGKALHCLARIRTISSYRPQAVLLSAQCRVRLGQPKQAAAELEELCEVEPDFAPARAMLETLRRPAKGPAGNPVDRSR